MIDAYSKEEKRANMQRMARLLFKSKRNGEWVEDGCDVCHKGMVKKIYDFQRANRKAGTICSTCDKKQRLKDLKDD